MEHLFFYKRAILILLGWKVGQVFGSPSQGIDFCKNKKVVQLLFNNLFLKVNLTLFPNYLIKVKINEGQKLYCNEAIQRHEAVIARHEATPRYEAILRHEPVIARNEAIQFRLLLKILVPTLRKKPQRCTLQNFASQ